MTALWFVLAAAAGGVGRHAVNQMGRAWIGTLAINVTGSFVLGVLLGRGASADMVLVVGTAGCGSFTTFSTFAFEAVEARDASRVAIVAATVVGTVTAGAVGYWVG